MLLPLEMLRRGLARFERMWLRWTGPLGLAWTQDVLAVDGAFPILPDLRPVTIAAPRSFSVTRSKA